MNPATSVRPIKSLTAAAHVQIRQPAAPLLEVNLNAQRRRITVSGEIDLNTVSALVDVIALLGGINPSDSTLDIGGLTFIDAHGLGCLVHFSNQLIASRASLSIVGASPRLRRIFEMAGLGALLDGA